MTLETGPITVDIELESQPAVFGQNCPSSVSIPHQTLFDDTSSVIWSIPPQDESSWSYSTRILGIILANPESRVWNQAGDFFTGGPGVFFEYEPGWAGPTNSRFGTSWVMVPPPIEPKSQTTPKGTTTYQLDLVAQATSKTPFAYTIYFFSDQIGLWFADGALDVAGGTL